MPTRVAFSLFKKGSLIRIKMPRTIYLAVFSNGAHPAHQAVFIPTRNSGDLGDYGKLIHVTGNVATGFFLQFKRNYNFAETRRNYEIIPLATVEDQCIKDTPGAFVEDTIARDRLESVATTVTPPGPSPKPFDPLVILAELVPLE